MQNRGLFGGAVSYYHLFEREPEVQRVHRGSAVSGTAGPGKLSKLVFGDAAVVPVELYLELLSTRSTGGEGRRRQNESETNRRRRGSGTHLAAMSHSNEWCTGAQAAVALYTAVTRKV